MRIAALLALAAGLSASDRPHVVFVTGDNEYRSEETMPALAKVLESKYGMRCSVAYARPTPQTKNNVEGLEALKTADLMVMYLRFRELPGNQLKLILDYVDSGKPMVGLRTSTHAFRYPPSSPHAPLNNEFGLRVWGQRWLRHHGAQSSTDVAVVPGEESNPILRGIDKQFHVRSWLYEVTPLEGDCKPLLTGRAVNPQGKDASPQPVAWTKTHKGARVFYTSLGHPEDFEVPAVRRLLVNGIQWALGR
jgi:type 1 glutamine amidotransferase